MKGFFVTGTGTGVGKTVVTALLVHGMRREGLDVVPAKPIQTGAEPDERGIIKSPDLEWIFEATGLEPNPGEYPLMAPCVYRHPCSPHLAARLEKRPTQPNAIIEAIEELASLHEYLVVEGAGGILVPMDEEMMMIDMADRLDLPVVIAAHAGLGTINHTLLTLEVLKKRGLEIAGVILNEVEPVAPEDRYIVEDNIRAIGYYGDVTVLGCLGNIRPEGGRWRISDLNGAIDQLPGWNSFREQWIE